MRQTTWTPVYFIAQLFYFIALVRTALGTKLLKNTYRKPYIYRMVQLSFNDLE